MLFRLCPKKTIGCVYAAGDDGGCGGCGGGGCCFLALYHPSTEMFEAREHRLQKLLSSAGYGGAVLCQEGLWDALSGARLVLSWKLQTRPRAWNIVERGKQFLHCNVQVFDGWQVFLTCRHDLVLSNALLQCLGKPRSADPSEIVTENTKISCSLLFQNILNMLALDCLCFV